MAHSAAEAAAEKKASDIRILDVSALLGITDFFVIISARNERQLRTVTDEIQRALSDAGAGPRRREGSAGTGWVVLDYGDIVVHIFTEEQRRYYELERLWSDAPTTLFDQRAVADA